MKDLEGFSVKAMEITKISVKDPQDFVKTSVKKTNEDSDLCHMGSEGLP